ncbi:YwiC-like family protein [Bacillus spongiae]|uniref:YwiC-like family protein n=1 Tax=Bacillus spongiae TaxID=2683610 RepID=A0ABU8HIU0_9BACI
MKVILPKQHGAWAMLILPFLLSSIIGNPSLFHLPLFFGWLFLYLATYPLLLFLRRKKPSLHGKWASIYLGLAFLFLIPPLLYEWRLIYFGIAMIPFFIINIYFAKINRERAFWNDVTAISSFCVGGLASYYLGVGSLDEMAWFLAILSFLFFLGSTFYVKTMIREKKNPKYKWYSWGYHALIPILLLITGNGLFLIAYIPSVLRAFLFYGKKMSIKKVGILEIENSVFFLLAILMIMYI